MLDGRDTPTGNDAAQLIVEHSVAVGIFAAPPTGQLPSLGPLSGQPKTHQLVVSQVMSKPSQNDQSVTNNAALSCTTTEPSSVMVMGGSGCAIELGLSQTQAQANANVEIALNGLNVTMPIGVWAPTTIEAKAEDEVLNRIGEMPPLPDSMPALPRPPGLPPYSPPPSPLPPSPAPLSRANAAPPRPSPSPLDAACPPAPRNLLPAHTIAQ